MAKLTWDKQGERLYETGVQNGVLYPMQISGDYSKGVAWNGLSTVTESPSGAEASPIYADNIKYLNLMSAEEFGGTIEAYTYPDEFAACDGSIELETGVSIGQQKRQTFGLSYRTVLGNDVDGEGYGYKLHLVYGAMAAPSEKAYASINDSPDAISFSWDFTTTPVAVTGFKPSASIIIDSSKADSTKLAALEAILYGDEDTEPRLPLPDEIKSLMAPPVPPGLQLISSVPIDGDTNVTGAVYTETLTFNNAIASDNITFEKSSGAVVTYTKAWDSTKKILTITNNTALSPGTSYTIHVNNVVDVNGQTLNGLTVTFSTPTGY